MWRRLTSTVVLAVATLTGCGEDETTTDRLEAAACADLRAGMTVSQVAKSGVRNGLSRERVAAALVTGIRDECPEFQDDLDGSPVPGWLD